MMTAAEARTNYLKATAVDASIRGAKICVMLVEDNRADARLVREMLNGGPEAFEIEWADTLAVARDVLGAADSDVVPLDLGLPDSQGFDTLLRARQPWPEQPIIVLSSLDDEVQALQALQLGAQDHLVKGQFEAAGLTRAIRYAIERNQSEHYLRESVCELEARTEEMEAFTYSVSHDLTEPLRMLEAFSRFLIEDYADRLDDQGRDYLDRIGRASARLTEMIEEVLVLSRLGRRPSQMERVVTQQVVEEVVAAAQLAITEKHARVTIEAPLPDVLADAARIEQIFGNLISNGLKFSKGQPRVHVGRQRVQQRLGHHLRP